MTTTQQQHDHRVISNCCWPLTPPHCSVLGNLRLDGTIDVRGVPGDAPLESVWPGGGAGEATAS